MTWQSTWCGCQGGASLVKRPGGKTTFSQSSQKIFQQAPKILQQAPKIPQQAPKIPQQAPKIPHFMKTHLLTWTPIHLRFKGAGISGECENIFSFREFQLNNIETVEQTAADYKL